MSLLIINTLGENSKAAIEAIGHITKACSDCEIINICSENINNCEGCYHCLLVNPGVCRIKDDFEKILKLFMKCDNIIFISKTTFGFIDFQTKKILERFLPIVTFFSEYRNNELRNIRRYKKDYSFGIIYEGEADKEYTNYWFERASSQLGATCLGVYPISETKELIKCIC